MGRAKISVVGAGSVGASCARRLAECNYADIVLVDQLERLAGGIALDINHAAPIGGYEPRVTAAAGYEQTAGSDLCVIAAGLARRPGMGRDDLMAGNAEVVEAVAKRLAERSPDAILIVVTNPLDAMCHVALDASGFTRQRVIGMSGVLDSARWRSLIAAELEVSVRDVTGMVLGGHGEMMVPVLSSASVAGLPVGERIGAGRLEEIIERTREGGSEVVALTEASPSCAPSAGVVEIADSIIRDERRILSCAALCQGEFQIRDVFVGVPCRLGADGIEEIVEFELAEDELSALQASADSVREVVAAMTKQRNR